MIKFNLFIIIQSILLAISSFIASSGIFNNPHYHVIFSLNIINVIFLFILLCCAEFIIILLLFEDSPLSFNNLAFSIIYNCIFFSILCTFVDIYFILCFSYIFQQILAIIIIIRKRNRK